MDSVDVQSIVIIIGYLVATTVIGSLLARRTTGSRQWAVAGGGMGMAMIAVGIAGTRIGGAGTYGVAEKAMSGGLWYMWWYSITTFLALAIVGLFFAIPYRRMKLQTVGEMFTVRFGSRRCQVLTSLCVQTEYFIINLIEVYLIAAIIEPIVGIPFFPGVFIAAAILVTYISLGGLWGSAYTNLIHCSVILIGLLLVGVVGLNKLGGWEAVTAQVNTHLATAGQDQDAWWGFLGAGWLAAVGMFFSAAVHTPAASVYTNFSTAAKSEKILIPGFLLAGLIASTMPLLAGFIGILTLADIGYASGLRGYTNLTALATSINPFIGGVALAAILAAVISSGGPILLSSSTMFVRDWLPFTRDYSPERKLLMYRGTTVVYGIVAAISAIVVQRTGASLLDLLLFGFTMVVPPAVAVAYVIYWRRTTEFGAFAGMAAGYAAGLAWFVGIEAATGVWDLTVDETSGAMAHLLHWCFVNEGKGVDPSYAATFVPLFVVPVVSWLGAKPQPNEAYYEVLEGKRDRDDEN